MTRLLLLGSGELGREVALEAARLGIEVVAADRYDGAPAMLVTPHRRVLDMTDPEALSALVHEVQPDLVVPEVEALATEALLALEEAGTHVVPTARATRLTMDREGIRRLAAEELGLATSPYRFASSEEEYVAAVAEIGTPCVVKPVMSSSGKGQSTVRPGDDPLTAWAYARDNARVQGRPVIVEGFVDFVYEITLLTVSHAGGITVCPPVGHVQEAGDYRESWQPHPMSAVALERGEEIARTVVAALGGHGLFGVELFVTADDEVLFSEVSPRPHDTGMVTMISQPTSEFALHVRAILGLPVRPDDVAVTTPSASAVVLGTESGTPSYAGLDAALAVPTAQVRVFGKPTSHPGRRLAVALAQGDTIDQARERAREAAAAVRVSMR
ncbi:formate-dependent phosphoribosylglycinamide formyltransferase [Nocardioides rubriscoriae]|uniref:formate-dependent phosphoribosylglycinamide formyltransferase n=1 Tax=Nocardioides rubriscoriae TaxID=642762 RepID=UPI0011DF3024|nr:formate-dependent phosphoribosylglycinamide formyltransferase [Nocardioides rubriscoriae]